MSVDSRPKLTFNLPVPGGQIQAAVWENEQARDDKTFTNLAITFSRRYFDEDEKKWKTAKSFRAGDLLPIAFAAQELVRQLTAENPKA